MHAEQPCSCGPGYEPSCEVHNFVSILQVMNQRFMDFRSWVVFSNDLQDSNRIFNMGEWESVYRGAGGQGVGIPNILEPLVNFVPTSTRSLRDAALGCSCK